MKGKCYVCGYTYHRHRSWCPENPVNQPKPVQLDKPIPKPPLEGEPAAQSLEQPVPKPPLEGKPTPLPLEGE